MKQIKFLKYHGLGNDFIIIEEQNINYSELAKKVCHRQLGIGADGLLVVRKSPLTMLFYNQDGSEGTMCGNGLRCFSRYARDSKITIEDEFDVLTKAGNRRVRFDQNLIEVNMGKASYSKELLQLNTDQSEWINSCVEGIPLTAVYTGTVHGVVFVNEENKSDRMSKAKQIHENPLFKAKANINFVEVMDKEHFWVRTYERGVGWTLACGTGACASFIVGSRLGYCKDSVEICFEHGSLWIRKDTNEFIYMKGPAQKIASGLFEIENI